MALVWSDIRDLPSGEFSEVSQEAIERAIAEAERELPRSVYGDRYDDAHLYLAAHLLAVQVKGSSSGGGPVVMESAGPVSRQYAQLTMQGDDSTLLATAYGRRFRDIRQQCAGVPRVL